MNRDRILVRNWLILFYFTLLVFIVQGCLSKGERTPDAPAPSADLHTGVTATVFSFARDAADATGISAWNDVAPLAEENPYYVALPFNPRVYPASDPLSAVAMKNRWVEVTAAASGKTAYAQVEDVGPWFVNDHPYVFDPAERPFAEGAKGAGFDIYRAPDPARIVRNKAGIDLSPALAEELGVAGLGIVAWRFVEASAVPDGPWKARISTTPPHWRAASARAPFVARDAAE